MSLSVSQTPETLLFAVGTCHFNLSIQATHYISVVCILGVMLLLMLNSNINPEISFVEAVAQNVCNLYLLLF